MTVDELARLLREMHVANDQEMRRRYHRSVPFGDALLDRFERAKRLGFGDQASIFDSSLVMGDVAVGAHSWIGPHVMLDGGYGPLHIGSYVSISAGTTIYTHDTVLWSLSGGRDRPRTGPVTIGDNCYIGSQVVIGPSVTIEEQSVVATNSYVSADVAARTIVGGTPARVIGRVNVDGGKIILDYVK